MAVIRFAIGSVAALGMMGGMFWALWALINLKLDVNEVQPAVRIEFTRLRKDTEVETRREEKPKLELAAQAPTVPAAVSNAVMAGVAAAVSGPLRAAPVRAPGVGAKVNIQKIGLSSGGTDRDAIPLVRIDAEYPRRALELGIEGWVLVRFSITPAGTVKDAVVVDSDPEEIFDASALKAVARYQYKPRIENGVATERRGVQLVIRFKLNKERQ